VSQKFVIPATERLPRWPGRESSDVSATPGAGFRLALRLAGMTRTEGGWLRAISRFVLQQHERRILDELSELLQKLRSDGTIDDSMIAA
jgi:hypothetical protein